MSGNQFPHDSSRKVFYEFPIVESKIIDILEEKDEEREFSPPADEQLCSVKSIDRNEFEATALEDSVRVVEPPKVYKVDHDDRVGDHIEPTMSPAAQSQLIK